MNALKSLMSDLADNAVCQYAAKVSSKLAFEWKPMKDSLPLHYKSGADDLIEGALGLFGIRIMFLIFPGNNHELFS